jgi:hypothetical protein
MEVAPDLQFRHHRLGEIQLPAEAFVQIAGLSLDDVCICCDVAAHVYNPEHSDPQIVAALHGTHWIDVREFGPVKA